MQFVESTSIEAIGYDPDTMELHVRFLQSKETYAYYNVPSWVHDEFMQAESKGVYLNSKIKKQYEYSKL